MEKNNKTEKKLIYNKVLTEKEWSDLIEKEKNRDKEKKFFGFPFSHPSGYRRPNQEELERQEKVFLKCAKEFSEEYKLKNNILSGNTKL